MLQEIFAAAQKFQTSAGINVQCEITILDLYKRVLPWKMTVKVPPPTTHSPNSMGLEKASMGDPDNSPLTGHSCIIQPFNQVITTILCCYFCYYTIL